MIVGPHTGELGFELAIWLPFLRREFGESLEGITAVSRGGTELLYPCPVINAHDVMSNDEMVFGVRDRMNSERKMKPVETDRLDAEIMRRLGLYSHLHPARAYALKPWKLLAPYIRKIPKAAARYPGLPEKYVAIRLYANDWLEGIGSEAIQAQTGGLPAVILEPYQMLDNHREFAGVTGDFVVNYSTYNSIDTLVKVFGNAEKVITTYGGTAWLALACGTKVHTFTDKDARYAMNLEMDEAFRQFGEFTVEQIKAE